MFQPFGITQLTSPSNSINDSKGKHREFNSTHTKKKIGDYAYYSNDLIGSGYSSHVYICHHKNNPNSQYAIKVVKLSKLNKSHIHLLQNEIKILQSLDHPNIVKFHAVYYTQNNCYLITDYCEGGTLQAYAEKKKILDLQDLFDQLVQGCKYLAQKLIIHRDIKPVNVFRKGKQWKIGDFGFARYLQTKQTLVKQMYKVGSPLYMPPETIKNSVYSLKTDSYALGVLFFYITTKDFPYPGNNNKQLIQSYESKQFPIHMLNHLPNKMICCIKNLCNLNVHQRSYISDLMPTQKNPQQEKIVTKTHTQTMNNFIIKKINSIGSSNKNSPQKHMSSTSSSLVQQIQYEKQTPIREVLKEGLQLDTIQKIKLCKVFHHFNMNIKSIQRFDIIRKNIRQILRFLVQQFEWLENASYAKYVQQFSISEIEPIAVYGEIADFLCHLSSTVQQMSQEKGDKVLQIIRLKMIQVAYILKLMFTRRFSKMKQFVGKLVLHPDFSKVFMFPGQIQQIQKIAQKIH